MSMIRIVSVVCCLMVSALLQGVTISNPTKYAYEQALIRLNPEAPLPPSILAVQVLRDGVPVLSQVEPTAEGGVIWVAVDLASGAQASYTFQPIKSNPGPSKWVQKHNGKVMLSNGRFSLVVPDSGLTGTTPPAPIAGIRFGQGDWIGGSQWTAAPDGTAFRCEVLGEGPLFAKVRLHYEFLAGQAEIDFTLPPGRPFALVESRHHMRRGDGWTLDLSKGWNPESGQMRRWYSGLFQGAPAVENFPLKPGLTRLGETVIHLQPRWTQSYDEGWNFGIQDATRYLGALVIRAGQWEWPHDNKPVARMPEPGDRAELFLPTFRGARSWLLLGGDADLATQVPAIVRAESFLNPDKLTHAYRLPFAPGEKQLIGGIDFYSNQTNPTGMMRQQNRRILQDTEKGKTADSLGSLYQAQAFFDPDWYGDLDDHWSPINPNFYTDFIKGGIALTAQLRDHPVFPFLRDKAEAAFRDDVNYAVTLPGGAGQECPGYQHHAMTSWLKLAPVCAAYLKFDPREWPRYTDGARFLAKISVPAGNGNRQFHPAGDTHPDRPNPLNWAREMGVNENPRNWETEEFPGFGVVMRQHSGSEKETFLSFKAGPNRGHYHGDQLAIHWCANAGPVAVDHHASYKPRPGQEHMHNRLSFSVEGMPYANMDGHERLIAFRTSPLADVAVAEVESLRLREVKSLPPEDWDVSEPQVLFDTPLRYRRTVILLKGNLGWVVMVDEFSGPEVTAAWNLHVLGDQAVREGDWINFGNAQAFLPAEMGDRYETLSWEHENGGREKTTAARLFRSGRKGRYVSVLVPGSQRPDLRYENNTLVISEGAALIFGDDGRIGMRLQGEETELLSAADIDLNRPQGKVGLFIPDVGYPFGPVPDWLIEQRGTFSE